MSKPKRNPGPVPPRWLYCPRKSENLIADKFMALKTPLSSDFDDQVPPECRFDPKMVFDIAKSKKIKFGLWIDLTNTSRFYNKADIGEYGCKYVKLQCRGHGETPSREQTATFIEIVTRFISYHPLESIAVHCTHGFNRTGFLIVSYLVEKMDCDLGRALALFAESRPVGIYKGDYIQELYKRYDDVSDAPPPPSLPDWCTETDDVQGNGLDDFDDVTEDTRKRAASTSSNNDDTSPKTKKRRVKEAVFMEGVPNVTHFQEEKATELQKMVQKMCKWGRKGFPGSQPVSMDMNNINLLKSQPYRVSWKADGMRYMMLINGEDEVYFFDRDNEVFKVEGIRFVYRSDLYRHLNNTLLDGEMVIDKVNGQSIPRYLVYDVIVFENNEVGQLRFYPERLQCIENDIIKPRYMAMEKGIIIKNKEPFSVRKKDFWDISQAGNLLGEKFARTLSHEPDGLIFQPSLKPYVPGRCDEVLKWKPPSLNSVDFRLKINTEKAKGKIPTKVAYLFVSQQVEPFASTQWTKEMKGLDNKIIECKFEDNRWKFMRERTDKSFPNHKDTALGVCESIVHPVTNEYLLQFIDQCLPRSKLMPAPSRMIRR
ncbi:mRNA-capping enzyme [Diabrotica undecimpunctata]|uniref:mRNA-capping enzyme n=1 Tax=Diabrotica undecimpunctata TaxID=50387 RepID=UPI003B6412B5